MPNPISDLVRYVDLLMGSEPKKVNRTHLPGHIDLLTARVKVAAVGEPCFVCRNSLGSVLDLCPSHACIVFGLERRKDMVKAVVAPEPGWYSDPLYAVVDVVGALNWFKRPRCVHCKIYGRVKP